MWRELHPRTPMRWEWDDAGDGRVARLWHLRAELSSSDQVIYTKWFRGRATFFSRPAYTALLRLVGSEAGLSRPARDILENLKLESPLSTQALKRATGLQGRQAESAYERALRELWARALIVGYGEADEGAFPSLALGATQVIFESLWDESARLSLEQAQSQLEKRLGPDSPWMKHFLKIRQGIPAPERLPARSHENAARPLAAPQRPAFDF